MIEILNEEIQLRGNYPTLDLEIDKDDGKYTLILNNYVDHMGNAYPGELCCIDFNDDYGFSVDDIINKIIDDYDIYELYEQSADDVLEELINYYVSRNGSTPEEIKAVREFAELVFEEENIIYHIENILEDEWYNVPDENKNKVYKYMRK